MSALGSVPPDPERWDTPAGYQGWTAAEKSRWLWETLVLGTAHHPTALPALEVPFRHRTAAAIGVVARRSKLSTTLTRTSDLMEPGRPKVIHARGAVAMIELETDVGSPFTGLLAPPARGGASGLVRMSLVAKVTGKAAVTPGLGLKLLIDSHPSADLLAMNHVVGQGRDFDLFSNTLTNDLTEEHRELRPPQRLMSALFRRVSHEPRRLTVRHLATRHRDGTPVETEPVAPRRLVLRPTAEARTVFVGQAGVDFRRVLAEVPAGTPLYEVDGLTGPPGSADRARVGVIRTATAFVSSDGGDRLFFRHVQDATDLRS